MVKHYGDIFFASYDGTKPIRLKKPPRVWEILNHPKYFEYLNERLIYESDLIEEVERFQHLDSLDRYKRELETDNLCQKHN